jgi:phospholipid-binding lipoprotein MlaA
MIRKNKTGGIKKNLMTGCIALCLSVAAVHAGDNPEDPWEGFNRGVFSFNKFSDTYLLKPVAQGYDWIMPQPVKNGISNVFHNLGETKNFLNNTLQFKYADAGTDVARFAINTTVGVLGIFDIASVWGFEANTEDFGQTLAAWGFGTGPYVVLPFLGPSNIRDGIGLIPDAYSVPQTYIDYDQTNWSVYGVDAIDTRAGLFSAEELIHGDEYSFIRDVYFQRREFLVNDGVSKDDFVSGGFEYE